MSAQDRKGSLPVFRTQFSANAVMGPGVRRKTVGFCVSASWYAEFHRGFVGRIKSPYSTTLARRFTRSASVTEDSTGLVDREVRSRTCAPSGFTKNLSTVLVIGLYEYCGGRKGSRAFHPRLNWCGNAFPSGMPASRCIRALYSCSVSRGVRTAGARTTGDRGVRAVRGDGAARGVRDAPRALWASRHDVETLFESSARCVGPSYRTGLFTARPKSKAGDEPGGTGSTKN